MDIKYTGSATTATASGPTLTLESLRRAAALIEASAIENHRRTIADMAAGLFNPFGALTIREHPLATQAKPIRIHKRRRNQSAAYHARIQKKWINRFGMCKEPCAYQLDGGQFGMGSVLVVHPEVMRAMRAAGAVRSAGRAKPWEMTSLSIRP